MNDIDCQIPVKRQFSYTQNLGKQVVWQYSNYEINALRHTFQIKA